LPGGALAVERGAVERAGEGGEGLDGHAAGAEAKAGFSLLSSALCAAGRFWSRRSPENH
jgi:hypothetical protein